MLSVRYNLSWQVWIQTHILERLVDEKLEKNPDAQTELMEIWASELKDEMFSSFMTKMFTCWMDRIQVSHGSWNMFY